MKVSVVQVVHVVQVLVVQVEQVSVTQVVKVSYQKSASVGLPAEPPVSCNKPQPSAHSERLWPAASPAP